LKQKNKLLRYLNPREPAWGVLNDRFDEVTTVIMFETKGKSKGVILPLALSSNTIHQPAYAHKQNQHPKSKENALNRPKCCRRKAGGMGIVNRT